MKAFVFWSALMAIVLTFVGLTVFGCAPVHPTAPPVKPKPVPVLPPPHQDPPELKPVGVSLNIIIVLATVALGTGVGLLFVLPAAHQLSLTIAGVAGGIQLTCLILRVSLWFIPWIAMGLAAAAVGFFIYELIRNHAKIANSLAHMYIGAMEELHKAKVEVAAAAGKVSSTAAQAVELIHH